MKFDEILEACWKGYHKEGMKTMFGKRYPNCVKNKKKKNEDMEPDLEEGKRIARKPGQPAGSKKHSDLYTDENPKGTITGLKFATVEDARASVSKIRNSGRSHAHKIQAAVAMEQRARAAGKASAAAVYRRYINANKRTDEQQQLDEKCWDGYAQQGVKKKGDRMVPNCVRVAEDHTPDHTTAMSLAQDLNTMMADVAEIRHAGEASTNLNYLRELQRRIGVTQKQILNLGYKYDVNHPDLVRPLGQALAEVDIGPEITMNQLLYKAAAQAMRDAGREGIAMDYEDAIEQASRIYNIPYRPSELPKLRAQLKDLDQRLDALRAQKALGKQMRQQQKYGNTAADSASAAKIAPRLDRIKPATKTLEETEADLAEDLKKWFKEKWVRFGPDGKIRGPCARGKSSEGKSKCLPQAKAHALGKKGRAKAGSRKRRQDPDANRRGKAINVKTKEGVNNSNQNGQGHADQTLALQEALADELKNYRQHLSMALGGPKKINLATTQLMVLKQIDKIMAPKMASVDQADKIKYFKPFVETVKDRIRKSQSQAEVIEIMMQFGKMAPDILDKINLRRLYDVNPAAYYQEIIRRQNATQDQLEEAGSPAQQAAIAIAMKKAGKKPKSVTEGIPFDQCPACGGPIVHISLLSEKQDACYHKVKSRYKVWPSAYASGALVQCRKKGAANWGTGGKKK